VAWEAANKVGGIYTVLKTKASVTVEEYGDRYCVLGPLSSSAQLEVEVQEPSTESMRQAIDAMTSQGIKVLVACFVCC